MRICKISWEKNGFEKGVGINAELLAFNKGLFICEQYPPVKIYTALETIDLIMSGCSISRFGDGEFDLMLKINHPKYQNDSLKLRERLIDVFKNRNKKLLVCIPKVFSYDDLKAFTGKSRRHWERVLYNNRKNLYKIFDFDYCYGDALLTRCYIDLKNKQNTQEQFSKIKNIWQNKEVIIVEGRYTRFGVGNDLLDNAKSVVRILCPEKNAFDKYDEIMNICKLQNKEVLFLLALGPTATVLASDLCNLGFQAIDIGHLDIEYEWFRKGVTKKVKVDNKWVNETNDVVTKENDTLHDYIYAKSIIATIA